MMLRNTILSLACALAISAAASAGVYKALLVGCEEYADDVDPFAAAMPAWDAEFWNPADVVTMKNPEGPDVLGQIARMLPGTDFFFFAYTGHGAQDAHGKLETVPPAL